MNSETRNGIVASALLLAAAAGWYLGYVQPREDFLLAVADCTSEAPDHADPEVEWARCSKQVRAAQ